MPDTDSLFSSNSDAGPDFCIEESFFRRGIKTVAGVDEAGRGPLAGPVVAAAVILDPDNIPVGLNDSKKLTENTREKLFEQILKSSHVCWASLPPLVIDEINIREASLRAMTQSVLGLPVDAAAALVDGRDVPVGLLKIGHAYVKGDARSVSIAAASIVAKVIRDRMLVKAGELYPQYGFEKHKGYGSKLHRDAIDEFGPCPLHRMSFSPMKGLKTKKALTRLPKVL